MIAPEGIRDGQHYAEALYTFAGEGVEDLPFKKGDMIEVLDCADANWWRGKNLSTDEDGLFPACLVKFTNAPVHQEAMKTTERLARLSDVLTPSYMKPQNGSTDSNGAQQDRGRSDANSIEALLLNLADNEMQVQQQKVQAHMPRKPTRMKLLYEDHTNPGSAGRTNTTSKPKDTAAQKRQEAGSNSATNPNATGSWAELPVPNFQKKKSQPQVDMPLSQAGIWGAPSSRTSNASTSNPQLFGSTTSFTSSLESMRDATQRSEEASRNRSSGSMLFGPRVMPTSRSSSRTQQNASASIHSEKSTMRLNDVLSTLDSNPSLSSLYSASDRDDTISRESHAAHQQAITEARQLMDGIPSPTEFGSGGDSHNRHEAEYLFSDNESDVEASVADNSKLQAMMSPSSENSARFVSYSSTVSSQTSEVSEPGKSKRLPVIPSSANLSLVSDTSSVGLAGQNSSAGDLAHLHRSWYSSTESLNLMGGGGASIKSPVAETFNADDVDGQHDTHAPRMTKQKSRIRPTEGSLRVSQTDTLSTAYLTSLGAPNEGSQQQHSHNAGKRDVPNQGVSNFQHMVNMSANAQGGYSGVSAATTVAAADMRPVVTGASNQYPGYVATNGGVVQYHQQHPATNGGVVTPVQQTMQPNAVSYQPADAHSSMAGGGAYGQQGYNVYGGYVAGVDGSMGYTSGSPGTAMYAPMAGQMREGYAQLGMPLSVGPTYSQQPQTQVVGAVMMQGQTGRLSPAGPYAMDVSGNSAVTPPVISAAAAVGARPRSYTAGASVADGMADGHLTHTPTVPQQPQPSYQQQTSQLRPSVSASGLADAGGEMDVRSRLAQNDVRRPVSFGGTGSVADTRAATPESAQSSVRSSGAFGTVSSAPTLSGAQRDGRMSPFPSNVGAAQTPSPSLSGATVTGADTLKAATAATADELDAQLLLPLPENITPINYVKMARPVFKFGGRISRPETMVWGRVDRQMTMLKTVSAKLTVEALATMHVGRPFNKPIERIRAAFVWIASNVQYDGSIAESNDEFERNEAPSAVLQRRRSRGPGFAYLFDAMMRALGIESHAIRGYLRQPLDTCRGPVLPAANHVWNVVCLDGEYRIVDSASAAKSHPLNAECKVDSWFFLASPKEAIFTHFPLAPEDQFIDPIVTLPIFWMLPYVRPAYFQTRVKLLNLPLMPRIELKDDQVVPLVLCVRDSALAVFAEIELHDPNGSGRIVARQPLLAQCMDYKGRRMVKVLVGVRAGDARGLLKIYCGPRASQNQQSQSQSQGESQPSGAARAHKVLGFLHGKERRASAHDYSRVQGVDEDGRIRAVATAKSYPLACALHVTHRGRSNAPLFVQPSAAAPNEFYIKEPTSAQLHLGESVGFHLLPVGDQRLFHVQLRSPGGQQHKFVYQPSDQGYVLRHAVKERGAWIIVYHSDAEGWLPIASYQCV
ncbi:hypothetical protein IWW48_002143 [Coemansia sp. RSA 1200]|nr:hypothetical protein IWW48_002143 [Coemansia sp. RSA 1200]